MDSIAKTEKPVGEIKEIENITVRFADDGTPVTAVTKLESHWTPGYGGHRDMTVEATPFKLNEKVELGTELEFDGNDLVVVKPTHSHLEDRWGKTSVFVERKAKGN